jgi:hypothetical protein
MPIRFLVEVLWMGEFDALHISAPFDRGDGAFLGNPHLFSIVSKHTRKASKQQEVARALRGDRLTNTPAKNERSLERAPKQMPVGCDRAFSSLSGPQSSRLFGRCLV